MKQFSWWPAAVALAVLLAAIAFIVWAGSPRSADSISADDIQSIEVRPWGDDAKGRFTAAAQDHARLLALVQHGTREPNSMKWASIADLDFHLHNGRTVQVLVFRTGSRPAAWKIDDTYYRGSSNEEIIRVIRDAATRGKPLAE